MQGSLIHKKLISGPLLVLVAMYHSYMPAHGHILVSVHVLILLDLPLALARCTQKNTQQERIALRP